MTEPRSTGAAGGRPNRPSGDRSSRRPSGDRSLPVFDFHQVTVRFDERVVLDGVDVTVQPYKITVVAGPSGSGKTTLLRLCNRLELPTSGRLLFRGSDVAGLDPTVLRRNVGMVFQRPTLFPGTVRDNLRVARQADDRAYAAVLDRVGLPGRYLDEQGDTLSGGEAQRACLARTLLTEPEVLLMDEPTSSLDPAATTVLESLTRELKQEGMTVLWVSHDLEQARRIADEHMVLLEGRLASAEQAADYLDPRQPRRKDGSAPC